MQSISLIILLVASLELATRKVGDILECQTNKENNY